MKTRGLIRKVVTVSLYSMKKAKSIVLFVLALSFTAIVFLITIITYGFMTSDCRVDDNFSSFLAQTLNEEISPQQFSLLCESNNVQEALLFRCQYGICLSYELRRGTCFCIQATGQLLRFPDAAKMKRILNPQEEIVLYDRSNRDIGRSEAIHRWRYDHVNNLMRSQ